ncbi:MAG TPA: ribokinase [Bacteroidota bacterium]|nr:ribokinase [Bacteroidota bacterium]
MKKKIAVIGSSNIDFIMKMPRLPKVGETITDGVFFQTFGGKGANQAVGAARAGGNVSFVNCVGDDDITPRMVDQFNKAGINTDFVFQEKNISSGTALVMIGDLGTNYLSVAPGANYRLTPRHIDKVLDLIKEAEIIVLQYEILPETLKYVLDVCHQRKKRVLWNFAPAREFDRSYLKKVEILVVNESEAEYISGIAVADDASVSKAATEIARLGCETVIITIGARGSFIYSANGERWVDAFKVNALDTTGAGDIYCGCLAVALVEGKDISEAVRFATAGAAISVTRLGAQPSAPTRGEIENFLRTASP